MVETRFDVVVVGSGPAGVAFALALAQDAPRLLERTVFLEKATHPREKYCGGAVSAWGLDVLASLGVPLGVPHVPIEGIRVRYGDAEVTHRGAPLGIVCRRAELDAHLVREARRRGADVREAHAVAGLRRDGAGWIVETSAGDFGCKVVVGADGAGSRVRKLAGIPEPRRKGRLYVTETPPLPHEAGDRIITFDLSCVARGIEGYYWDFPTVIDGVPAVSRGVYHRNAASRPDLVDVLRRELTRRGLALADFRLKPFAERGFTPGAVFASPGLLLVGEAAGVDPVTGEGIAQAWGFGRLAARTVARALADGDLSFRTYARDVLRSDFARHLRQSARLAPIVYGPRAGRWVSFLLSHPRAVPAGAEWYAGRRLGWRTKLHLALGLARFLAAGRELPSPYRLDAHRGQS